MNDGICTMTLALALPGIHRISGRGATCSYYYCTIPFTTHAISQLVTVTSASLLMSFTNAPPFSLGLPVGYRLLISHNALTSIAALSEDLGRKRLKSFDI